MMNKVLFTFVLGLSFSANAANSKKKPELTPEEQRVVAAAGLEFMKAHGEPPPSLHMQDKMQSSVPTETAKKAKKKKK